MKMMELTDKKIKILEIVEQLLTEKGSNEVSVRDIAAAANINVAMISYYFGSKENVLEMTIKYRYDNVKDLFLTEYEEIKKNPNLNQRIDQVIDMYASKAFLFKPFRTILEENKVLSSKCRPEVVGFHLILVDIFNDIIKEGVDRKIFSPKLDVNILVGSMIGTLLFFLKSRIFAQEFVLKDIPEEEHTPYLIEKITTYMKTMVHLALEN